MADPTHITPPDALRALVEHDAEAVAAMRAMREQLEVRSGLDEKAIELARLAALVAMTAPAQSFQAHIHRALTAGASAQEVWGTVLAVAPLVGIPSLVATVPSIADALA